MLTLLTCRVFAIDVVYVALDSSKDMGAVRKRQGALIISGLLRVTNIIDRPPLVQR